MKTLNTLKNITVIALIVIILILCMAFGLLKTNSIKAETYANKYSSTVVQRIPVEFISNSK